MRSARIHVAAPNETCKRGSVHDIARTENGGAMIAFNHGNGSSLYRMPKFELETGTEQTISFRPNDDRTPMAAFSSPMVSMHVGKSLLLDNVDDGFQCTVVTRESKDPGNFFTVSLERTHFTYLKLGLRDSSIWASAANGSRVAISGTDCIWGLQISSGSGKYEGKLDIPGQSRALDWVSHNTVAFGVGSNDEVDKVHRKQQVPSHGVQLWDLRSSGTALRLKRMKPVTGIKARETSQLLVSDNHRISLFDLRYEKDPVLFWNHRHQGPQLQFDTMVNGSIMAALDADNNVQTYSLQSGKAIAALQRPPISTRNEDSHRREVLIGKVRWTADDTTLQACQGDSLIVWNYGGMADDEA
ncbi:hypothetical protein EJ03DRAFT_325268 [Teratosphaeria nubilosa]|uniref:WD40 repeat-like protein n=1 Tax=Teratosphaeria nubilosa TaxID=161662 RepID=A0A6G1LG72_9PEZI|nr:hypothetical protein EJ03DRAFT_325268 [Teratosphaeria nubilosa]